MDNGEEFDAKFTDEAGMEWDVKLSVPVVFQFTRDYHLALRDVLPGNLDAGQLLDLAWRGTRYQSQARAYPDYTLTQFLESLDGPSFETAQEAAARALLNFIRRHRNKLIAKALSAEARLRLEGVEGRTLIEGVAAALGAGTTSASSVGPAESTSA